MDNPSVGAITANDIKSGADLVNRIRAGDPQAEDELIQRYNRGVSFIIHREARNAAVAEDLCQETFRIALEKIRHGDVREPEKLSGFITSLARNLVIEHFRRASRQESLNEIADTHSLHDHAPSQLDELLQKEKAMIVRQVISELKSERDRQMLFRLYIAEEEKEKICADLGLTSLHFNRVRFRALKRFKEQYQKVVGSK